MTYLELVWYIYCKIWHTSNLCGSNIVFSSQTMYSRSLTQLLTTQWCNGIFKRYSILNVIYSKRIDMILPKVGLFCLHLYFGRSFEGYLVYENSISWYVYMLMFFMLIVFPFSISKNWYFAFSRSPGDCSSNSRAF